MKIFIFGGPGSGKTTLAKRISKEYHLPFFELDTILYKKQNGINQRRDENERLNIVKRFACTNDWIAEGIYRQDWLDVILKKADIVAILIVPKHIRNWRTTKRTIKRMIGLEKSDHDSNFKLIIDFIKFNDEFENERYAEFDQRLKRLKITPTIIKNYEDFKKILEN